MVILNTNLGSLIVQSNLAGSTNSLNQAIERMTTGFKINHAKDNAANYSISTNMSTKIGAYQNRLESALDEISIQYENLASSRSTIRDADIAEESSAYIRSQILQQAAATLLATANQTPAIALQLL